MERILEPEVMDTWEEAIAYDAMDFTEVNTLFAQQAIALGPNAGTILDVGTGTARIPILINQLLISQKRPEWQITAIDLAENMLKIGAENVKKAGLQQQIFLEIVDAKQMPYQNEQFDLVISNSIVHHLPDPLPFFQELKRVLKPNGGIFIRDLLRPIDTATMHRLVERIGPEYDQQQKKLFRDSLNAAFTLEEIQEIIEKADLKDVKIYQSSDRHWTAEKAWVNDTKKG